MKREIGKFILGFRLWILNTILCKIPFNGVRNFIYIAYITKGRKTNILPGVKILNRSLKRDRINIGNNCIINHGCLLDGRKGKIIIEDNVDIARGTWIFTMGHDPHSDYHEGTYGNVIIEKNVWIASRVTILPGVRIGEGAVIATGAVVTKDIPPNVIAGGIPANVISERRSKKLYKHKFFPYWPM